MKKLGIVVPVKNQHAFILSNLNSLLSCNPEDLDVIIVDGGSSDGTLELCANFVKAHPNFSLISGIDDGQADAIAIGFSMLNTEWLGWLNGDDYLLPWSLKNVLKTLNDGNGFELIYGNAHFSDIEGYWLRNYPTIDVRFGEFSELVFEKLYLAQPSIFYKKSLYLAAGGIDIDLEYVFDYELWSKMSMLVTKEQICYLPVELSSNREYSGTKTQSNYDRLLMELVKTQQKIFGKVSAYVVQAVSDFLYSSREENKPFKSFPKRFLYYKKSCVVLNIKNPSQLLKLLFCVPLALSGSIVGDRVGVFRILTQKLRLRISNLTSKDKFRVLSKTHETANMCLGKFEFVQLRNLDENEIFDVFSQIRSEDPDNYFNPHDFDGESLNAIMAAKQDFYSFVRHNSQYVGYVLLRGLDEGYEDFSLGIFVFKRFRGTGVAQKLMESLEDLAVGKGVSRMRLSVYPTNYVAKRLYGKLKYKQVELRTDGVEIWIKEISHANL